MCEQHGAGSRLGDASFGAWALGRVFACATTPPPSRQPPAALLEIAGLRRRPDEPLAAFLLRAHSEAQRRTQQPQPRYWWDDTDEG